MGGFRLSLALLFLAGSAAANEYACTSRVACKQLIPELQQKLANLRKEMFRLDEKLAFAPGDEYDSLQLQRSALLESISRVELGLKEAMRVVDEPEPPSGAPPAEIPDTPFSDAEVPLATAPDPSPSPTPAPPDREEDDELAGGPQPGLPSDDSFPSDSVLDEDPAGFQTLEERFERFGQEGVPGLPGPRAPGQGSAPAPAQAAHGFADEGYDEESEEEEEEPLFRRALSLTGGDRAEPADEREAWEAEDEIGEETLGRGGAEVNFAVRINNRFGDAGDPEAYEGFAGDEMVEGDELGADGEPGERSLARQRGSRSAYGGNGRAAVLPAPGDGEGGWADWENAPEGSEEPNGEAAVYGPPTFEAKALGEALAKAAKNQTKLGKIPKWSRKKAKASRMKKRKKVPHTLWTRFLHKARQWGLLPAAPKPKASANGGAPHRDLAEAFFASTSAGPPHLWAWYALGGVWLVMGLTFLAWRVRRRRGATPPSRNH